MTTNATKPLLEPKKTYSAKALILVASLSMLSSSVGTLLVCNKQLKDLEDRTTSYINNISSGLAGLEQANYESGVFDTCSHFNEHEDAIADCFQEVNSSKAADSSNQVTEEHSTDDTAGS